MTVHKVEGATFHPPNSVTTSFETVFEGAQAYTVLSRIKQIDQLYLINDVYRNKIYANLKALRALKDLENKAINANSIGRREDQIKIACLNSQNLVHHIEDIKQHHKILEHNLICLSETWLSDRITNALPGTYQIPNYTPNYINVGNGKGLATFSEPSFYIEQNVLEDSFQVTKYSF